MKNCLSGIMILSAMTCVADISSQDLGGEITLWPKDPGLFVFVDCQSELKGQALNKTIKALADDFNIDIRKINGDNSPFDLRLVPNNLKCLGAKGAIWIVSDVSLPVVLTAPEDGWGVLNVAPLMMDSPDAIKLEKRVVKFVNRVFGNINGIGDSVMMPACVMKQAIGIKGVDALVCATYSPEANSKIAAYLSKSGYKQRKRGTYYDACEEGWAPAPTNAVQKKIWDKVHQLPTKPLVIVPESKRKKK